MYWSKLIFVILWALIGAQYVQNQKLDWWQTSIIYEVLPRSFQDSDGDGIGDLKGIEQRADYFKQTGVGAVYLTPIYPSPQIDSGGYDISDYTAIDPILGTIQDVLSLLNKLNSLGIKLILNLVPNYSSDQHVWFKKSIKKEQPYTNYYVWKDPIGWHNKTTPIPPNNWLSLEGGSAWEFNKKRRQFYLHQFLPQEPDLNYHCPELLEEMKNIFRFYLDRGINGFRTDSAPYLVEDDRFLDEPLINGAAEDGPITYNSLNHIYTADQPQTYDILRQFREILDSYTQKGGPTRLLLTEACTDIKHTLDYYGTDSEPIAHMTFDFFLLTHLNDSSNAKDFNDAIYLWLNHLPKGKWPNWLLGNQARSRIPTRFEPSAVDAINILILLLPGTAITYYGEEIGMEDTKIRPDQAQDKQVSSRDPEHTPFQWDSSLNAGFSSNTSGTWLSVNPNYYILNLEEQKKDPKSHYNIYRSLIKLRSTSVFQTGDFSTCMPSEWVFSFARSLSEKSIYLIVLNLNNEEEYVNLVACTNIPNFSKKLAVQIASQNSEYNIGNVIDPRYHFQMRPKSALVLQ